MANPNDPRETLSTAEAAQLAGVGPSSVKRWADQGLLRCVKTAGGHRRFERTELERFLRSHVTSKETASAPWLRTMLHGDPLAVEALLLQERASTGAWFRVADGLGPILTELGARWERGTVTVADEHIAATNLQRALSRVSEGIPVAPGAPVCVLAAAEGDEHTLGLSLAELTLREAGFATLWVGAPTPTGELLRVIQRRGLSRVCLSASVLSRTASSLKRQAATVGEACAARKLDLVLGGEGAWPDVPAHGVRLHTFEALRSHVTAEPHLRQAQ